MKIICEKKNYIETSTSCKKEYCCDDLKTAMESWYHKQKSDYNNYLPSNFKIKHNKKIILITHEYDYQSHEMEIFFCPFCGTKIDIEKTTIDETKDIPYKKEYVYKKPEKKNHWWD